MKYCDNCNKTFDFQCDTCDFCKGNVKDINLDDKSLKEFLDIDDRTLARFKEIRKRTITEAKHLAEKKGGIRAIGISGSARDKDDAAAEDSNSEFLLKSALDQLRQSGAEAELISLRNYNIQHCKACYSTTNAQCHFYCSCYPKGTPTGDDMSNILYDKVLESDIIIFATPVNNFKISTLMAAFIDRCISLDGSLEPADLNNPKNKELNIKHTKFIEACVDQKIPGSGFLRRFAGKIGGIIVTGHEEGASMAISSLFMTLSHYGMIFPSWSNVYAMSSVLYPTCFDRSTVRNKTYEEEVRMLADNTFKMAKVMRGKMRTTDWEHDYSAN